MSTLKNKKTFALRFPEEVFTPDVEKDATDALSQEFQRWTTSYPTCVQIGNPDYDVQRESGSITISATYEMYFVMDAD